MTLEITDLLLSIFDGNVHQLGIVGLLRSSQDQRGVGGRILRLILGDGCGGPSVGCA